MGTTFHNIQRSFVVFFLALLSYQAFAVPNDFPIPESIRPAINFWVRVYTEVDTKSGFLHDSKSLGVVYARLDRDSKVINARRKAIAADLKVLATGKREGLSSSQAEILALWPKDVSNERLATAAKNVRWQLGQSDRFVAGLLRSGAYRTHIENVVTEKGLPIELSALPHVESSFHPGAYSSAAATGMWQFVRSTAARFMRVDYVVDERLDPYAATYGAMELLEYNYNALGSWPLALTAYNHGANGMARAVRDVGTDDIGVIITQYKGPRFGFASRNFYPQFLAVQEVEMRSEELFGPLTLNPGPEFAELKMTAFVDAKVMAESIGVGVNALKRDNPALQPSVWSGTKRIPSGYSLKVNKKDLQGGLLASLDAVPGNQLFGEQIPDISYKIRSGDSLSVIADRYDTSVSELVAINQLRDRHRIRIGQTLLLPQSDGSVPTLLVSALKVMEIPESGKYEVQRGDSISTIAESFKLPVTTLLALNSMTDREVIYPGQSLNLRGGNEEETQLQSLPSISSALGGESDGALADATNNSLGSETSVELPIPADVEAGPQLASLSVDFNRAALAVNDDVQEVENQQQLNLDLAADPSDYTVDNNSRIEIQAVETLGHYADWLGIRTQSLRLINNMSFKQQLIIGKRLKLDFSKVDIETFEKKRREFHRDLQSQYFSNWRIQNTEQYNIKRNDFLVNLARERSVPMWLFRQYNPEVDSGRLQIGQVVVFPVMERVAL